jgi:adenosylcobinamide-GDP ribazoletransferase
MGLFTAIRFLTVIPLPRRLATGTPGFVGALPYFPVVGLIVGGLAGGVFYFSSIWITPMVGAALAVALMALLSGGHHLDGLVDTFDGIGESTPDARLAAMRSVHAGAAGISAAAIVTLVKFAALASLGNWLALIAVPVLSRGFMVSALYLFPAARPEGMAATFKAGAKPVHFIICNLLALGLAIALLGPLPGLAVAVGGWLLIMGLAWYLARRFGGLTGDTLGAIGETGEMVLLVILAGVF